MTRWLRDKTARNWYDGNTKNFMFIQKVVNNHYTKAENIT